MVRDSGDRWRWDGDGFTGDLDDGARIDVGGSSLTVWLQNSETGAPGTSCVDQSLAVHVPHTFSKCAVAPAAQVALEPFRCRRCHRRVVVVDRRQKATHAPSAGTQTEQNSHSSISATTSTAQTRPHARHGPESHGMHGMQLHPSVAVAQAKGVRSSEAIRISPSAKC